MTTIKEKYIPVSAIVLDDELHTRKEVNEDLVSKYVGLVRQDAPFPPIEVCYDGKSYWIVDGYHRAKAYAEAGRKTIPALIRQGSKEDAVKRSLSHNLGSPKNREDRRVAVEKAKRASRVGKCATAPWEENRLYQGQSLKAIVANNPSPSEWTENVTRESEVDLGKVPEEWAETLSAAIDLARKDPATADRVLRGIRLICSHISTGEMRHPSK